MKTNKIYISGSISNDILYEFKFKLAEIIVKLKWGRYNHIINPIRAKPLFGIRLWIFYIIKDLWLLAGCKAVVFLPDWKESKGAKVEMFFARLLRKKIDFLNF